MKRALVVSASVLLSVSLLAPVQAVSASNTGFAGETVKTGYALNPMPKPAPQPKPAAKKKSAPKKQQVAKKPASKKPGANTTHGKHNGKSKFDYTDTTQFGAIRSTLAGLGTTSLGGGAVASLVPVLGSIVAPVSLASGSISVGVGNAVSSSKDANGILQRAGSKK